MKTCPHCGISVGGVRTVCPLCQNPLIGEESPARYPKVEPALRRASLLYKIVAFLLLSGTVICAAIDFIINDTPHLHWSIVVLALVLSALILLRTLLKRRYNAPRLLFQILIGTALLALFLDFYLGWTGLSLELVLPVLCTATLIINFGFAFVNKRYTENGLVYLLLNMLIGIIPYLALLGAGMFRSLAWVICLVVSVITFLGLVIFRWRELWSEMEKRLHL